MANWYVTDSEYEVVGGTAYAGQTVDLTISPVSTAVEGESIWSGAYIQASQFRIGGATETSSGSGIWEDGNVTSGIASVTFSDLGTAGESDNTVRARVTFESSGTFPTSVADFVIDIDQVVEPPTSASTPAFLRAQYGFYATGQSAPAVANIGAITGEPDITETVETAGSTSNDYLIKFTGDVEVGQQSVIAKITFAASSNYYYADPPTIAWLNIEGYENYYSENIQLTWADGLITGFVVKLIFQPFAGGGLDDIIDAMNHRAIINYDLVAETTEVTDTVTDVVADEAIPWYGGQFPIVINGEPNSEYIINLKKKVSLTSDETVTDEWFAETGDVRDLLGEYDFRNKKFSVFDPGYATYGKPLKDKLNSNSAVLGSNGTRTHLVGFPRQTITRRYDIEIEGLVNAKDTTLNTYVPTKPGDKSITQYGLHTLSITPITYDNTSNFGTLPSAKTAKRPIRYTNDPYVEFSSKNVKIKGGTGGVSSTTLTLQQESSEIYKDMLVSGVGVSNGTKVTRVRSNIITLSTAATVASDTEIRFDNNDSSLVPFSFTITPAQGKILSVTGLTAFERDVKLSTLVGGIASDNISRLVSPIVSDSTTVVFDVSGAGKTGIDLLGYLPNQKRLHGTRGIVPGMSIHDSDNVQLTSTDGTGATVASVTNHSTFEANVKLTIPDGTTLYFQGQNREVDLVSLNADKVGNDVVVTGSLKARDLVLTGRADVYLDSLITVHT